MDSRLGGCAEAAADKAGAARAAAWAALLRLVQLYMLAAPAAIEPELAQDLAVITASAFDGADTEALGVLTGLRQPISLW